MAIHGCGTGLSGPSGRSPVPRQEWGTPWSTTSAVAWWCCSEEKAPTPARNSATHGNGMELPGFPRASTGPRRELTSRWLMTLIEASLFCSAVHPRTAQLTVRRGCCERHFLLRPSPCPSPHVLQAQRNSTYLREARAPSPTYGRRRTRGRGRTSTTGPMSLSDRPMSALSPARTPAT